MLKNNSSYSYKPKADDEYSPTCLSVVTINSLRRLRNIAYFSINAFKFYSLLIVILALTIFVLL